MSYKEIRDEMYMEKFGDTSPSPPERKFKYYYYKEGKCVLESDSPDSYPPSGASPIREKVLANKKEIDQYWDELNEINRKALEVFMKELREKYSDISDDLFNICYSKSYEENHSAGYDEVANGLWDIVYFAKEVLKIKG